MWTPSPPIFPSSLLLPPPTPPSLLLRPPPLNPARPLSYSHPSCQTPRHPPPTHRQSAGLGFRGQGLGFSGHGSGFSGSPQSPHLTYWQPARQTNVPRLVMCPYDLLPHEQQGGNIQSKSHHLMSNHESHTDLQGHVDRQHTIHIIYKQQAAA